MSVVGNLEDLSFPDILQIVHLSRQTGTLVLAGEEGERRVRFKNGRVCGATLGRGGPELEELLLQKGLVSRASLSAAREQQAQTGEPLPGVLVRQGAISQETIERVVREELGSILRSLVLLQNGEFRFDVEEDAPQSTASGIGLTEGLEPSTILPDLPAGAPFATSGRPAAGTRAASKRALVVIERSYLRLAVRDDLLQHHWDVNCCSTQAVGRDLARSLVEKGASFDLVCDLLLPDASGGGWCGGLELVREVKRLAPRLAAIVIGEVRDPRLAEEAQAAGAAGYLAIPDLGAGGLQRMREALGAFCAEVRGALQGGGTTTGGVRRPAGPIRVTDSLSLLRGLIGEMRADQEAEIPLLVLRLAAEYFERGSLFMVRGEEALGIGGFGAVGAGRSVEMDGRVRGIALPLLAGSALARSVTSGESVVGPIPGTPENRPLLEALGAPAPAESALVPLSSGRTTIGILYGDNAGGSRPIGDLKALEIFLSQAGFALENAGLQRRIQSLARPEGLAAGGNGDGHGEARR